MAHKAIRAERTRRRERESARACPQSNYERENIARAMIGAREKDCIHFILLFPLPPCTTREREKERDDDE